MIKNIIFDYGFVLAYPRTGSWFVPPKAQAILGRSNMLRLLFRMHLFPKAYRKARRILDENHLMHTEEEEIAQFTEFYQLFLREVGINKDLEALSEQLAVDLVCNDDKVIFYDDVIEELSDLHLKYNLAVLSDTWPSLKRILDNQGISSKLKGLIMSCDYGICKDNIELFHTAIDSLRIEPNNTIFIDDSESNLENAEKAGLLPVLMDRRRKIKQSKYPIVRSLKELNAILIRYNVS